MVKRGGILIMLSQLEKRSKMLPNALAEPNGDGPWDAYIWIGNADDLCAEFKSKGVAIAREICDLMYGCRDFEVLDPNGYRLCFGQDLN